MFRNSYTPRPAATQRTATIPRGLCLILLPQMLLPVSVRWFRISWKRLFSFTILVPTRLYSLWKSKGKKLSECRYDLPSVLGIAIFQCQEMTVFFCFFFRTKSRFLDYWRSEVKRTNVCPIIYFLEAKLTTLNIPPSHASPLDLSVRFFFRKVFW